MRCDTKPAGTIYSSQEELLGGLPSQESVERTHSNRWLLVDLTDYKAKGYYAGRQEGMQTTICHPRRFVPVPQFDTPEAQLGDEIDERNEVTANLYSGDL